MKSGDYSSIIETAMRVALMRNVTAKILMERFGMNRYTAYRWILHLNAAKGAATSTQGERK